jgi:hypothetical protein
MLYVTSILIHSICEIPPITFEIIYFFGGTRQGFLLAKQALYLVHFWSSYFGDGVS